MKRLVCIMLLLGWAVSAQAATVYLKDGGTIRAQKVWRKEGTVVVLLNRDSITSFSTAEINLRKTFPTRKKVVKPAAPASATPVAAPGDSPAAAPAKAGKGDKKLALPALPSKLLKKELPKGTEEGTIRKQKREMEERIKE